MLAHEIASSDPDAFGQLLDLNGAGLAPDPDRDVHQCRFSAHWPSCHNRLRKSGYKRSPRRVALVAEGAARELMKKTRRVDAQTRAALKKVLIPTPAMVIAASKRSGTIPTRRTSTTWSRPYTKP